MATANTTIVTNQGLPPSSLPLLTPDGKIHPVWYQFLSSLWQRSGGGTGQDHSVTVNSSSGIIASVTEPGGNAVIDLSLGGISPTAINCNGPVVGATGDFAQSLTSRGTTQFGVFTGSGVTNTGYIAINDVNGNPRKLMVGT